MTDQRPTDKSKLDKLALGLGILAVPASIVSGVTPAEALQSEPPTDKIQTLKPNEQAKPSKSAATTREPVTAALPQALATSTPDIYRVRAGDTLSAIASKHSMSLATLLRLNKLHEKSVILPGQVLRLNPSSQLNKAQVAATASKVHVIKAGETLGGIAKKHGVTIETIIAVNNLKPGALIFPGQQLIIGTVVPKSEPAATKPKSHLVKTGDTIVSIARKYGISQSNLLKYNGLKAASIIYAGQTLQLSGSGNEQQSGANDPSGTKAGGTSPATSGSNPCRIHGYHKVKAGETASKIAAVFGVSTQSLLTANKLEWSSPIFVGQKLLIPGGHSAAQCPNVFPLTKQMRPNAELIVSIGRELRVPDFGIVIALATAAQESSLINLEHGDRDSLGLFQQRPSVGWGTKTQVQDPEYAIRAFFGGPNGPNAGKIKGLLDIAGWQKLKLTEAAQAVQISAYPNAYAKWENSAWVWFDELNGGADA